MTVRDLLTKSFLTIRVLGAGEAMSADEASDALDILNEVIEQSNIDKLASYYQTDLTIPLQGNKASYTIGPASSTPDVTATRPVEILSAYARRGNIDLPTFVGSKQDWNLISKKDISIAAWEMMLYYEAQFPKGVLYLFPVPLDTLTTVYLTVNNAISTFSTLDDVVSFPPGYRKWLRYKVALNLCPEYGMTFGTDNFNILYDAESALKRNNSKPMPVAGTGLTSLTKQPSGAYNVYSDSTRR
jgi:hypothetical protein